MWERWVGVKRGSCVNVRWRKTLSQVGEGLTWRVASEVMIDVSAL